MRKRCSIICDIIGSEKSWSWYLIHRNKYNESTTTGLPTPQPISPATVCNTFFNNLKQADLFNLKKLGGQLFISIFPEEIISEIRRYKKGDILFRVPPEWADVPFELCYDSIIEFLGVTFQIGTIVYLPSERMEQNHTRISLAKQPTSKMLILADPAGDLPSAHTEGIQLKEYFKKKGKIAHLIAHGDKSKILDALAQSNCVHFAGHSTADDIDISGWKIGKDTYLTIKDIEKLYSNPSLPWLVFSNSCHGGRFGKRGSLAGIAGAFLKAGIQQCIGPITSINDRDASAFALFFYCNLFRKKSLLRWIKPANLLMQTKQKMVKHNPSCITPLFYRLFGDPRYSIKNSLPNWHIWIKHRHNLLVLLIIAILMTGITLSRNLIYSSLINILPKPLTLKLPEYTKNIIAQRGEEYWTKQIDHYTQKGLFIDDYKTILPIKNRNAILSTYMIFPELQSAQSFTDKRNEEYFVFHTPDKQTVFTIKYNKGITDKFLLYTTAIESVTGTQCQFLGKISDIFADHLNNNSDNQDLIDNTIPGEVTFVMMDILSARMIDKMVVNVINNDVHLAGENLIQSKLSLMKRKRDDGIPLNLASLPANLSALQAAKLFFHLSTNNRNKSLWQQLISESANQSSNIRSIWWDQLTGKGYSYFYVRTVSLSSESKEFYFQAEKNGRYIPSLNTVSIEREGKSWKVTSLYLYDPH